MAWANGVVRQWRDETTLWRSTVAAHPRSPLGQLRLGRALVAGWGERPDVPDAEAREAAAAFHTVFELNPDLTDALVGSGVVAMRRGDGPAAEAFLDDALARRPDDLTVARAVRACQQRWPAGRP